MTKHTHTHIHAQIHIFLLWWFSIMLENKFWRQNLMQYHTMMMMITATNPFFSFHNHKILSGWVIVWLYIVIACNVLLFIISVEYNWIIIRPVLLVSRARNFVSNGESISVCSFSIDYRWELGNEPNWSNCDDWLTTMIHD